MRIIIPSFEEIKLMPPTITLFNALAALGHEVIYITIFPDDYALNFKDKKIINIPLFKKNYTIKHNFNVPNVYGIRGIIHRIDNFIKSICAHRLSNWLRQNVKCDDLLWIVNEMTPILAGSSFSKTFKNRYIFTIYELHNSTFKTRHIKKAAQNAKVTVVPEYNRAHIQKYFFRLEKLPIILPNKPLDNFKRGALPIEDMAIREKIAKIKKTGKRIVLYMGIIGPERPLDKIIEAIRMHRDKYEFVILGRPNSYLDYLDKRYSGDFTYLGFVTPPHHINIASHADIGVLIYEPQGNIGLNALYCAPNKVYEYTGLGLPVLANDIPGLYNIVNNYRCGISIAMDNSNDISAQISELFNNYETYQIGAQCFYNAIDVISIIQRILQKATENNLANQ